MQHHLLARCQKHWQRLKITNEVDLRRTILNIFQSGRTQSEVLVEIYKLALPEWDRIEKVHGFPEVGTEFWNFICREFVEFDRRHHPRVFAGGLWLNNGFQSNPKLDPWELSLANCTVEYSGGNHEKHHAMSNL